MFNCNFHFSKKKPTRKKTEKKSKNCCSNVSTPSPTLFFFLEKWRDFEAGPSLPRSDHETPELLQVMFRQGERLLIPGGTRVLEAAHGINQLLTSQADGWVKSKKSKSY